MKKKDSIDILIKRYLGYSLGGLLIFLGTVGLPIGLWIVLNQWDVISMVVLTPLYVILVIFGYDIIEMNRPDYLEIKERRRIRRMTATEDYDPNYRVVTDRPGSYDEMDTLAYHAKHADDISSKSAAYMSMFIESLLDHRRVENKTAEINHYRRSSGLKEQSTLRTKSREMLGLDNEPVRPVRVVEPSPTAQQILSGDFDYEEYYDQYLDGYEEDLD